MLHFSTLNFGVKGCILKEKTLLDACNGPLTIQVQGFFDLFYRRHVCFEILFEASFQPI